MFFVVLAILWASERALASTSSVNEQQRKARGPAPTATPSRP